MAIEIKVAAVGDILMWGTQIASANKNGGYSFDSMFSKVRPYLQNADLTIGNLETTLSGREQRYQKKNPKTGYPMFNCPDELAGTLKRSGFDVLTTANNHCMDRGVRGLKRTLAVLDRHGLAHTGTYRSYAESKNYLIRSVKGVRVGILAYTYGTNYIPVPHPWMVNRTQQSKILSDLRELRKKTDVIIVALHFGREFHRFPSEKQRSLARLLLNNGADVILGAHPHVLQPMVRKNGKFVIYSLGNFISKKMWNKLQTESGVIVNLTIRMEAGQPAYVSSVSYIPTWTQHSIANGRSSFRVIPVRRFLLHPDARINASARQTLKKVWRDTTTLLKGKPL